MRRSMRRFSTQAQTLLPCGRCSAFVGKGVVSGSATDWELLRSQVGVLCIPDLLLQECG